MKFNNARALVGQLPGSPSETITTRLALSSAGDIELRLGRGHRLYKGTARLTFEPVRLPAQAIVERLDLALTCWDASGTDRVFERIVAILSRPASRGWGQVDLSRNDGWPSAPSVRLYGGTVNGYRAAAEHFSRPLGLLVAVNCKTGDALPIIDAGELRITYRVDKPKSSQNVAPALFVADGAAPATTKGSEIGWSCAKYNFVQAIAATHGGKSWLTDTVEGLNGPCNVIGSSSNIREHTRLDYARQTRLAGWIDALLARDWVITMDYAGCILFWAACDVAAATATLAAIGADLAHFTVTTAEAEHRRSLPRPPIIPPAEGDHRLN